MFCVLQLLLFVFGVSQGAVFTPEFENELRSFINVSMDCRRVPGMTLTVVKGDEVWSSGFGTADFSSQSNVDTNTLFNIGSVTKSFTATLLGMLLKENGYNWTTKVTDVLGQGYEFIDDYRTRELTMKDLLSHRTGLATLDEGLMSGYQQSLSREALCKNLKHLPAKRPVRDTWIYNNYLYMLLGHVAEVLGKDTWENLVTSRILVPLGMNSTRILKTPSDVLKADVARPYIYRDGGFQNGTLEIYEIHPNEPAGAILSSSTDMAKWLQFNLKLGKTEAGVLLLDRKLMVEMHWAAIGFENQNVLQERFLTRPQYPVDAIQIGYGYGWFISTYRGYKMVWHSGGLFSYITLFWIFPDANIGMYASVNGPAFKSLSIRHLRTMFYHITDHLLGLEPWLNETTSCTFPEPWANSSVRESKEPEVQISVENRTEYSGSFVSPIFPTIVVSANSTNMFLRSGRVQGNLYPSSEKDRFLWEITYPWEFAVAYTDDNNQTRFTNITFIRDKNGVVNAFKAGFEVDMTYVREGMSLDGTNGCLPLPISMKTVLSTMLFMAILKLL